MKPVLAALAAAALLDSPMVGRTEHELTARIESAYVSRGGMHHIHYLGITPMAAPDRSVPAQWPSARPVAAARAAAQSRHRPRKPSSARH